MSQWSPTRTRRPSTSSTTGSQNGTRPRIRCMSANEPTGWARTCPNAGVSDLLEGGTTADAEPPTAPTGTNSLTPLCGHRQVPGAGMGRLADPGDTGDSVNTTHQTYSVATLARRDISVHSWQKVVGVKS